jgi:hypothetical protein
MGDPSGRAIGDRHNAIDWRQIGGGKLSGVPRISTV